MNQLAVILLGMIGVGQQWTHSEWNYKFHFHKKKEFRWMGPKVPNGLLSKASDRVLG